MEPQAIPMVLLMSILAAVFTFAVVFALSRTTALASKKLSQNPLLCDSGVAFVFEGSSILDATPDAQSLIASYTDSCTTRADVGKMLESSFPGISKTLSDPTQNTFPIAAKGELGGFAELSRFGGSLRLTLKNTKHSSSIHPLALSTMQNELNVLRVIGDSSPQLIWCLDPHDEITWANKSYIKIAETARGLTPGIAADWPPMQLFAREIKEAELSNGDTARFFLNMPGVQNDFWYDVTCANGNEGLTFFAVDVSALVKADRQGRAFFLTLTRTFADLSTGLAVFDRSRKLVVFNPALHDLTKLPMSFLSCKPTFSALLDRLRDAGMLPEPKDYTTWRDQVAELEKKAVLGTYSETWALPGGEIYRVTGRPHPNGALALLLEDITTEVSLTRNYRAEIEMSQSVIDSFDDAVSVFSCTGTLILSNTRYETDWSTAAGLIIETRIADEMEVWRGNTFPTSAWDNLKDHLATTKNRKPSSTKIRSRGGKEFLLLVVPLVGGATLVRFTPKNYTTQQKISLQSDDLRDVQLS